MRKIPRKQYFKAPEASFALVFYIVLHRISIRATNPWFRLQSGYVWKSVTRKKSAPNIHSHTTAAEQLGWNRRFIARELASSYSRQRFMCLVSDSAAMIKRRCRAVSKLLAPDTKRCPAIAQRRSVIVCVPQHAAVTLI